MKENTRMGEERERSRKKMLIQTIVATVLYRGKRKRKRERENISDNKKLRLKLVVKRGGGISGGTLPTLG